MTLIRALSVLLFRQVLTDRAESLFGFIGDLFSDNARLLEKTLCDSSERAWKALELALAGPSWWQSVTGVFTPREQQALVRNIQVYLANLPDGVLPSADEAFRRRCLNDLRSARRVGLVPGTSFSVHAAAGEAASFARYGSREQIFDHERRIIAGMADVLRQEGYPDLAACVGVRPGNGDPLLVMAARHFFRREVEGNPHLAAGLTFERLEKITATQQTGFDSLQTVLAEHGARLDGLLGEVAGHVTAAHEAVTGAWDEVKTLREEMEQQSEKIRKLSEMLRALLGQREAAVPAPPEPAPAPPPAPPPLPRIMTAALSGGAGWAEVRRLLARTRQVAAAAGASGGTPDGPAEGVVLDALPAEDPPPPTRFEGPLLSRVFEAGMRKEEPPAPAPPPAAATAGMKRRLLSPLFDPERRQQA